MSRIRTLAYSLMVVATLIVAGLALTPVQPAHAAPAFQAPAPGFSKAFDPDTIAPDGVSTLTFTIDNTAGATAATDLDFTDNLPAAVVIATPATTGNTCTGGTLTAASGTSVITYSGGTVDAGATCTISVDVTSSTVGIYVNTTGDLTSSEGNSGTATDTLEVVTATIIITKDADPADGTDFSFEFDDGGGGVPFTLDDADPDDGDGVTDSQTFSGVLPGTYDITELAPAGWDLNSIVCTYYSDSTGIEAIRDNGSLLGVSITPDMGDSITCTFNDVELVPTPDLTVTKSNSASPVAVGAPWDWVLDVSNVGTGDATFPEGAVILRDDLPVVPIYPAGAAVSVTGGTVTGTITCDILSGQLLCSAGTGGVTINAASSFQVTISGITSAFAGTFTNPDGTCAVDPVGAVSESNEGNNACNSDAVVVEAPPRPKKKKDKDKGAEIIVVAGICAPDIEVTASPEMIVNAGDAVTWTAEITAPPDCEPTGVVMTGDMPSPFKINNVTATRGVVSVEGQAIKVDIGDMAAGEAVIVTMKTTYNPASAMTDGAAAQTDSQFCLTGIIPTDSDTACVLLLPSELPPTGGRPVRPPWAYAAVLLALLGTGGYLLRWRMASA